MGKLVVWRRPSHSYIGSPPRKATGEPVIHSIEQIRQLLGGPGVGNRLGSRRRQGEQSEFVAGAQPPGFALMAKVEVEPERAASSYLKYD